MARSSSAPPCAPVDTLAHVMIDVRNGDPWLTIVPADTTFPMLSSWGLNTAVCWKRRPPDSAGISRSSWPSTRLAGSWVVGGGVEIGGDRERGARERERREREGEREREREREREERRERRTPSSPPLYGLSAGVPGGGGLQRVAGLAVGWGGVFASSPASRLGRDPDEQRSRPPRETVPLVAWPPLARAQRCADLCWFCSRCSSWLPSRRSRTRNRRNITANPGSTRNGN